MNILNIGINNTANIYIDGLKENNSRIKNFYVTLNKEEYKYSNSINSFNYTSPVSLEFLLNKLSDYRDYDIFFLFYENSEDKNIVSPIVKFLNGINKYTNLFCMCDHKKYNNTDFKNIINNYNNIVSYLENDEINSISFISNNSSIDTLYTINTSYITDNSGYLVLSHATSIEELRQQEYMPTSLDCDLICTNFNKVVDKNKLVILDLSKESDLQSFSFNEIVIPKNMSPFDKLKLASLASQQTISLVDSINEGDPLSSRMRRYLNASCVICYVLGHNTLRDVINCLENPKVRERYMNELGVLSIHLGDEIDTLHSLNEYTKPTKKEPEPQLIGNKDSKIEYILDRICLLSEDFKLKYMFNKSPNNNINFVDIMNQGKILLIKMKESEYPTKQHKNILTIFFMSKIWLACQLRGSIQDKPLRTNIICDELFQAPIALNMLTYVLPQSRKFGCKLILSSQYLSQLKGLHTVLEACGASVMLMKGVSELDWKFYSSKIEGFEYDDLVNMPAYHSINLIYTHTGKFYNFLTQLPKPV